MTLPDLGQRVAPRYSGPFLRQRVLKVPPRSDVTQLVHNLVEFRSIIFREGSSKPQSPFGQSVYKANLGFQIGRRLRNAAAGTPDKVPALYNPKPCK